LDKEGPLRACFGSYAGNEECNQCSIRGACEPCTQSLVEEQERTGRHNRLQGKYKEKRGWNRKDRY